MNKDSLLAFSQLQQKIAKQYAVDAAVVQQGKAFAISEPMQQKFLKALQSKTDFLQKINMLSVTDIAGQKVLSGTQQTITGRKSDGRYRRNISPDGHEYRCAETDSGIIIPWSLIDSWARLGDTFMAAYADFVQKQIVLDQIMIGWRGESVATDSDDTKNGMLQDVNKGWMQWMRDNCPENILTGGKTDGKISIFGDTADYQNLDALAYDLRQGIGEASRDRGDLIFMVGSDLVAKEAELVSKAHGLKPTERGAIKQHDLMGTFGGLPAVTVPNFPARGAVITTYDNLSIYTQASSARRRVADDYDKKGVIDSYLRNEAFVVEDESRFVGIEFKNVVLPGE